MRVALDVTPARAGLTGVARHTAVLLDELVKRGIDVRAFGIGRGPGLPPPEARWVGVPLRVVHTMWRARVPLLAEMITGPVDLVHSVDLMLPPTRKPIIATAHDVAALENPALHQPRVVAQVKRRTASLDRADALVTNSQATADALRRVGVRRPPIHVVPFAPHPLPKHSATPLIEGPYVLAVGELTLRKDYPTMVRAFDRLAGPDHRLVIAGPDGFGAEQVRDTVRTVRRPEGVVLAGHVTDEQLATLYAHASALCLTSRQEGFGIPLVEAMGRGLPIVASDLEAVREVAGKAAVLVPAGDEDGFTTALAAVLTDDSLRATLVQNARERAGLYTWDRTASMTIDAYRAVLGE
ncbi:MAG: glycosyltransferase family 4 protein [Mycobacteriales bacterium]